MDSHINQQPEDDAHFDFIETYTGLHFYPYHGCPQFNILDIAHALSMCTRYNGHASRFYSVAEHSVMVANIMETFGTGDPLEGLMHDATEAYLTDVPAPFKKHLPDWQKFDDQLSVKLRAWMCFEGERPVGVKEADWFALYIEGYHLVPSEGESFADPENLRAIALELVPRFPVVGLEPKVAEKVFLTKFQQLRHKEAMQRMTS